MAHKLASLIFVLFLASCNNSSLTSSIHDPAFMPDETTVIPGESTTNDDSSDPSLPTDPSVEQNPSLSGTTQVRPPQTRPMPLPVPLPVANPKNKPRTAFPKSTVKMSKIIENAYLIMKNPKDIAWIKTACNRYVSLVLARSGYSRDGFLANDFDIYARKNLTHAKDVLFKGDAALTSELVRLKQHIWSYPERTPFILQWTRSGKHGHIAILERINDKLFIFQASLGDYNPKMNEIKVNTLLNARGSNHLNVYSEL